jgi:protein-L-isoaspartate(D-aspartate) O-methyltransferase
VTDEDKGLERRRAMVAGQLAARGIRDARVLEAMTRVPRERFVPAEFESSALHDCALSIGHGVTISQPYEEAKARLEALGIAVELRHADGFTGWPDQSAPFDVILLTAAPDEIPPALLEQLAVGGRLVAPVGERWQQSLIVIERGDQGFTQRAVLDVAFIPMLPGLE